MMKRILFAFTVAALLAAQGGAASAATQAGISAAVRGDIDLTPATGEAKHQAASGEDIYLGDEISSYDDAGMQLMLLDETVFTIGANTDITVDEFVYDPATGAGQVTASVAKGVFRFVTGNIAQGNPEDMTINLPVGTIGIRGTIGAGSYLDGVAAIVLLGPGPDNNANARSGHLEVSAQGVTINLTRPRYGTIIEPGQAPSAPVLFSDAQIGAILGALGPPPSSDKPSDAPAGGAATRAANQHMAEAGQTSLAFLPPPEPPDDLNGFNATSSNADFGITTFDQLRSIQTGTGTYQGSGVFTQTLSGGFSVNKVGTFSVDFVVDFGNQKFCPGDCIGAISINVPAGIAASTDFFEDSYANETDIFVAGGFEASDLSNPNFIGTVGSLLNTNGIIANQAFIFVNFDNGLDAGSGSGTSDPVQISP